MDWISRTYSSLRRMRLVGRGRPVPSAAVRNAYKEYSRMSRIALPKTAGNGTLDEALEKRTSKWSETKPLSLEDIGALLRTLVMRSDATRPYPSGGALYPVETYFIGQAENLSGVFHYHPKEHCLEWLWPLRSSLPLDGLLPEHHASSAIVFTAVWNRSSIKYGDFASVLTLLEAGHMAQNVLLMAAARGISARPMAGFSDAAARSLLDLDEEREQPLYAIAL